MSLEISLLFSFEGAILRSGDDGIVVTPVPIPNTEVKHYNGEGSWACPSENSKLPVKELVRALFFSNTGH